MPIEYEASHWPRGTEDQRGADDLGGIGTDVEREADQRRRKRIET
jgi:hypothetical protein